MVFWFIIDFSSSCFTKIIFLQILTKEINQNCFKMTDLSDSKRGQIVGAHN